MRARHAGVRPLIVPVFIPHAGCPHRCVFCNQVMVTGQASAVSRSQEIEQTILRYLSYRRPHHHPVHISFYGGNFLGLPPTAIHRLLTIAQSHVSAGAADGIRFSTRPDTVDGRRLALLAGFSVSTVEIGAQSMNDAVLKTADRGHTADDTVSAVTRLKAIGVDVGLQMMVGLPGETPEDAVGSATKMAALDPDFVRIYPTVVLQGSRLAHLYAAGTYVPASLDESISLVRTLYLLFTERGIPVIRMGLQASEALDSGEGVVAGPYHPAFGHLVLSRLFLDRAVSALDSAGRLPRKIRFRVHPKSESRLRGLNNGNLALLKKRFGLEAIGIVPDVAMDEDRLAVVEE